MVVPGTISRAFCLIFGALYPSYASFKALKSNQGQRLSPWLMYWTIFGLFCSIEFFADHLIFWIPFYQELKMIAILWLVLPQTQGSLMLYQYLVHPYLCIHEREIDDGMVRVGNTAQQMGIEFGRRGLEWTQQAIVSLIHKCNRYLSQHHPQTHKWIQDHTLDTQRIGTLRPGFITRDGAIIESTSQISGKKDDLDSKIVSSLTSFEDLITVNSGLVSDSIVSTSNIDMYFKQSENDIVQEQINQLERIMQQLKNSSSKEQNSNQVKNLINDTGNLLAKLKEEKREREREISEKEKPGGFSLFGQIKNRRKSSK